MNEESLSTGREAGSMSEVFLMAYPTVITMFSYGFLAAVDTAFVGKLGTVELAAVGLTGVVYMAMVALFQNTVTIVNTFVSQAYGAGRLEESSKRCWHGLYIALFSWPILIACIGIFDDILRLLGPSMEVQRVGYVYGSVRLIGSGLLFMLIALANFFRGIGRVKLPMVAAMIITVVNISLDYVMIFGKLGLPAMGVSGAAWASNIAMGVGVLFLFAIFLGSETHKRFKSRGTYRFDKGLIREMVAVGFPSGVQMFMEVMSFTLFYAFIGRMGDAQLAASMVCGHVMGLSFNVGFGISVATQTLVGQYLGADRPVLAFKSSLQSFRMVMLYTMAVSVVIVLFPRELIDIFSDDPDVIATGAVLAYMLAILIVPSSLGMVIGGTLRGAGDTRWPMWASIVAAWGVFLPSAYILGSVFKLGVTGAWAGVILCYTFLPFAYILRFRGGKWKEMRV